MEHQQQRYYGLSDQEVADRVAAGKVNEFQDESSRSVKQIVCSNVFTLFNLINLILFGMVLSVFSLKNATFMVVAVVNTAIGILQELRAKRTLDQLRILAVSKIQVLRNGRQVTIPVNELVQDDLVILTTGKQIPGDGEILQGRIEVNESLLTGESDAISKEMGAQVLSGSFVTSGKALCRVTKVGQECYMERIAKEAKVFKKHTSRLRNSINQILKFISIIIVPVAVAMFCKQYFLTGTEYRETVLDMVAAVVGMIPEGLVLLTSVALALGVIRLSRRKTLVQEMYCIETLARVDTLCLDKTGTLTQGRLSLDQILIWNGPTEQGQEAKDPQGTETAVMGALARMVQELGDENETAKALKEKLSKDYKRVLPLGGKCLHAIPFSSDRKYSGVSLEGQGTWYLGAYGFLFGEDQEQNLHVTEQIANYAAQGYRVLVVAHTSQILSQKDKPGGLEPLGLLLLTDVIRPEAPEILRYFREQDVDVRIISGDDPDTVRAIAVRAGMDPDIQAVNGMELRDDAAIEQALFQARIFGRVMPAQKEKMVELLQKQGHIVAMTGDGVNDVLALKKADCSIAMASGSDAAKDVANLVLLDSNFASLPAIVNEGRRVINNIKRASSMFLIKTIFSVILAVMTIFFGRSYPFQPVQLSIISAFAVGIPSFLLQLEPSFARIKNGFLGEVSRNAVPAAATIATLTLLIQNLGPYVGFHDAELATACVLTTGFNYVVAQTRVYAPLTVYRGIVVYSMQAAFLLTIMFIGRSFLDLTDLRLEMVVIVLMAVQLSPVINKGYSWLYSKFLDWRDQRILAKRERKSKKIEKSA